jgi:hypothetical protein
MPTLTIEDRTSTGRPTGSITMPDVPVRITLRDLIRLRVREEVARYNLRPIDHFVGLVQPEGAQVEAAGFRLAQPHRLDWERQADAAIASFLRNGFFVLVDGKQVLDLDAPILLTENLDVGFIKLTQLVGG